MLGAGWGRGRRTFPRCRGLCLHSRAPAKIPSGLGGWGLSRVQQRSLQGAGRGRARQARATFPPSLDHSPAPGPRSQMSVVATWPWGPCPPAAPLTSAHASAVCTLPGVGIFSHGRAELVCSAGAAGAAEQESPGPGGATEPAVTKGPRAVGCQLRCCAEPTSTLLPC